MKKITQAAPSRFLFELEMHRVELRVPYEVQVVVIWKRGPKRVETESNP